MFWKLLAVIANWARLFAHKWNLNPAMTCYLNQAMTWSACPPCRHVWHQVNQLLKGLRPGCWSLRRACVCDGTCRWWGARGESSTRGFWPAQNEEDITLSWDTELTWNIELDCDITVVGHYIVEWHNKTSYFVFSVPVVQKFELKWRLLENNKLFNCQF